MPRAADTAYEAIRQLIVSGELSPGDRLPEEDLAVRVGVSRTPVREALRRLASEGVVEFVPNRGAHVSSWSRRDLQEIFDLRAVLEGFAARLAARNASEADLEVLDDLATRMEGLAENPTPEHRDQIAELNTQFHGHLVEIAGNRLLAQQVAGLVQLPLVHRTFHDYDETELHRSMAHHRELLTALRHRDVNWAGTVMRSHIYSGRVTLQASLPAEPEPRPDDVDDHA